MPRVLGEDTDVLGVPRLLDSQLEYGADLANMSEAKCERTALGHDRHIQVQVAKVQVIAIEALVAVPGDEAHSRSVTSLPTSRSSLVSLRSTDEVSVPGDDAIATSCSRQAANRRVAWETVYPPWTKNGSAAPECVGVRDVACAP